MSELKIYSEFCFDSSKKLTIEIAHKALKNYADRFSEALELKEAIPVILDTNVLLAYYGLSQIEKDKLIEFLNKNKDRLFLTSQIEKEFLRNRIRTINKDFFYPLKKIQSDFQSTYKEIKNKLKSFLESNKNTLSKDYPDIWSLLSEKQHKLNEILEDEQTLSEKLAQAIETTTTDYKNIYVVDNLLEACAKLKITPALNDEEVDFVKKQYDALWQKYEMEKDETKRREITFPGCGDKRDKEDPYGDFIIFHEILKFMVCGKDGSDKTDVIFLTREKTKGDWIHSNLSPIIHYIEKAFLVTDKTLFIIHAEKPLEISFENIHKSNQIQENDLIIRESTILSLNLDKKWGFIYSKTGNLYFNQSFMEEQGAFHLLSQHDVVQYQVGQNQNGEDIATNVKKVVYSFEDKTQQILESTVFRIDKDKGYGFISAQPENLYFHSTFLKDHRAFQALEVSSSVEYIVGKNEFGEDIARLVREVSPPQNEVDRSE
ncbi:PIN-like domain-containing protein [Microcoleus sp. F10-C6]|uniref:PIN-like domain-containing protein n=1 Tax=unclassified Microcoleus TaxID=2642155 RepID=UPI002FD558DD